MTGLIAAAALGGAGLRVVLVDRAGSQALTAKGLDGRTTAIAQGSRQVLDALGVWRRVAGEACAIEQIRVADGRSPLFLHYDYRDVGEAPLGHIVENRPLHRALFDHVGELPTVALHAPATVAALERSATGAAAELDDGTELRASLVLACDGRRSALRTAAGIAVTEWRYRQQSIVCVAAHERPHGNIAHEHFYRGGPFAILPMNDAKPAANGLVHRSSIVWTERDDLAAAMAALDDAAFSLELARRFGDFLGHVEVAGARWRHPLALSHAQRYVDRRLALVGDAAHAIHPIAGQGLNMGIRDVAALAEVIVDARRLGLDIGTADQLARYERWRRFDNLALAVVTDVMNRLFSNDIAPLRLVRDVGLAAVNRTPPLKRLFMRHAMGMVGDLPRLVRGDPL